MCLSVASIEAFLKISLFAGGRSKECLNTKSNSNSSFQCFPLFLIEAQPPVSLFSLPLLSSGKWECPWHQCDICSNPAVSFCEFCPHSFCKDHEKGALVASALDGRLCCSTHDPKSPVAPEYWNKIKCKLEPQNSVEEAKE